LVRLSAAVSATKAVTWADVGMVPVRSSITRRRNSSSPDFEVGMTPSLVCFAPICSSMKFATGSGAPGDPGCRTERRFPGETASAFAESVR
jgi:hypothetical protein